MRADAPRFRDTRWGAALRSAPVTFALAGADIAVFGWVALHGSTTDTATLIRFGALEPSRVWSGEWWRLLTAAFLHVGVLHLTWNLFLGIPLCRLVEGALGARRFLLLYLLAALGASAASLLGHQAAVSAGASGALFGVAGAMFALFRRLVGSWGAFFRARQIRLNALLFGVFALAAVWLPIDQLAHAGGLVTGAVFAWLLTRPPPRRAFPWVAFAAVLGAAIALAVRPDPRFTANRAALQAIHQALRDDDPPRARALLDGARASGLDAAGLDYYEGVLLAREGDLEGALSKLRPLADTAGGAAGAEARRTAAAVARRLGTRLRASPGGERDEVRGAALLRDACRWGDPEACRLAPAS
jgi:membrane associated rhomboid family serine protease